MREKLCRVNLFQPKIFWQSLAWLVWLFIYAYFYHCLKFHRLRFSSSSDLLSISVKGYWLYNWI